MKDIWLKMNEEQTKEFIISRSKNLESGFKNVFKLKRKGILKGDSK